MARPLYYQSETTQIGQLNNRVDTLERRQAVTGAYQIKVFADDEEIETGNGAFIFAIPYDLDRSRLESCNIYITTVSSSGLVTVMIRNVSEGFDMLLTPLTIDVGELNAETAATPAVIDDEMADEFAYPYRNNTVFYTNQIAIDVDAAGTGAMGLGVMLGFA